MVHQYQPLERKENLSVEDFYKEYAGKKPVIFTPYNSKDWGAEKWSEEYFCQIAGDTIVRVRPELRDYLGDTTASKRMALKEYFEYAKPYYQEREKDISIIPPYAQDTPLFKNKKEIAKKLKNFPIQYFPKWYHNVYLDYLCFFFGPKHQVTPLHFDNCETHNLFFQIKGKKRFYIIPPGYNKYCYRMGWRRSQIDARNVDYKQHPLFEKAKVYEVVISPGEIIYMPPRTWHQVCAIDSNISFNLDWHTPTSAFKGVLAIFRGMPFSIAIFYNLPHAIGLLTNLPLRSIIRKFQGFVLM